MDYNVIIKNIAKNLKELRKSKKLTQEQLIKEIGEENISLRSYKSYENGKSTRVPLLEKIAILADYYGCSLDYIVFNKNSIYSDSFTKKDILLRLAGLIYSLSLIPKKETDQNNNYCGKYYFYSFDEEISIFMDKLNVISKEKNYLFKYKAKDDLKMLEHYYKAIEEMPDLKENWSPSIDRLNKVLIESGRDPLEYYKKNSEEIEKCRSVNALKSPKLNIK